MRKTFSTRFRSTRRFYVDVRGPGIWLRKRMGELGKQQDLDPRAKVTLDTVVYDPVTEKDRV